MKFRFIKEKVNMNSVFFIKLQFINVKPDSLREFFFILINRQIAIFSRITLNFQKKKIVKRNIFEIKALLTRAD